MKAERTQFRMTLVPEWKLTRGQRYIKRQCRFMDHLEAMEFANRVSQVGWKMGEPPMILVDDDRVTIRIGDGVVDGLREANFDLAERIDELMIGQWMD